MAKNDEPLTIHEAAASMRAGNLTPSELLEQCLARIDLYEPHVRAWVVIDREGAREQAARLTAELKSGHDRGPLHGIPIGVKDIIDVFDLPTGCGSKLWANSYARADARCIKNLRHAGAVILGKTVTTAYAYLDPPITRNPWNLARTPGGSSSGSAAAVACGMCLAALGTQTGGSNIRPTSFCGICGLKATFGRISCAGVLPLAPSLDHVGLMARCVTDLKILLESAAGAETINRDIQQPTSPPDCIVGRLRGMFDEQAEPPMLQLMDRIQSVFGPELDPHVNVEVKVFAQILADQMTLMAVEASQYHGNRLRRHPDDYPEKIRELVEVGLATPLERIQEAREAQEHFRERGLEHPNSVLVLLSPASRGPAPDRITTGDALFNAPWSFTGQPALSIPAGIDHNGMPMGIQLIGRPWAEDQLLMTAVWAEQRLNLKRELPPVPS